MLAVFIAMAKNKNKKRNKGMTKKKSAGSALQPEGSRIPEVLPEDMGSKEEEVKFSGAKLAGKGPSSTPTPSSSGASTLEVGRASVLEMARKRNSMKSPAGGTFSALKIDGQVVVPDEESDSNKASSTVSTEKPVDMSFPCGEGPLRILVYLISLPIMLPLWLTLPDTRNPKCRKLYPITFCGSILWIGALTYMLVWWATVVGRVFNIPPEVTKKFAKKQRF